MYQFFSFRKNALDYLRDKIGCNTTDRDAVLTAIFGQHGMTHADSHVIYEIRTEQAEDIITEKAPSFHQYFKRTMKPLLDENINCVLSRAEVVPGWTNNNAESMNHVIKMAIDWQPKAIPTLVDTLRDIIKGQYIDAERAMIGRGDYRLAPALARFSTTPAAWDKKTPQQRESLWGRFMKATVPVTSTATATTADGLLTVYTAPCGGKKPGQIKRKRNAKTTTVNKRPCA